ncbi:GNAT family N-acetyltransferase [Streptomyces sp. 3MP-14]|uniref:GNAT family N-acetyltransferase n=1 Tax=Streptomyces mimosae TaxID=2586635 RepID=A0A5N6AA49_9ACTN|nr:MULTISPECIES: GNAT family N-acetyltransferase [Streptomyces]KAB8165694.1 GNAT family N-acetyltransferase [Streptomyces mimosae]KAB8176083.1 GNAT family N-acetyltransferase [Streptomyces sp. 3MP-14]
MEKIVALLTADATPSAPALILRPWDPADAAELVELYRDDALRRWTSPTVNDEASAARWIHEQQRGWETGDRFGFAVVESRSAGTDGRLLGNVVLRNVMPGTSSAEVGYWTAAHARGRGVAPRALQALTDWAFTAFPTFNALPASPGNGLTRLELLHQVDNAASCRVAEKSGYAYTTLLPPAPPAYPLPGHLHIRTRGQLPRPAAG